MDLRFEICVGRKRTIVIPKAVAEELGIEGGSRLRLMVENGEIILEPIPDVIELSLRGEKIGRVGLEELRAESIEQQKKVIGKT